MNSLKDQLAQAIGMTATDETVMTTGVTFNGAPIVDGVVTAEKERDASTVKNVQKKQLNHFISDNGDEHTLKDTAVAEVKLGKRRQILDLPTGESVLQFAVWVHHNGKVAINFFGYERFTKLIDEDPDPEVEKQPMIVAKVQIWEKKTKSGRIFRYINFYPTDMIAKKKLFIGISKDDNHLVRFVDL